jgi:hypothetical protein
MTREEKQAMKELNKMVAHGTLRIAVLCGILGQKFPSWQEEAASLEFSNAFQIYRSMVEKIQQEIDALIEQDDMTLLLSRLSTIGPLN